VFISFPFWKQNHFTAAGGTASPRFFVELTDFEWEQTISVLSKFSRYFFQVQISERGLKTPSLPCGVLDNLECQINHSLAVNWLDRRKCNFHGKKVMRDLPKPSTKLLESPQRS